MDKKNIVKPAENQTDTNKPGSKITSDIFADTIPVIGECRFFEVDKCKCEKEATSENDKPNMSKREKNKK